MTIKGSKVKLKKFTYISLCCGVQAKKPPCERSKEDRKEHKFSEAALGKWRCTKCRKGCKVQRKKTEEIDSIN